MKASAPSSKKDDSSPLARGGLSRAPAGRSSRPLTALPAPHNRIGNEAKRSAVELRSLVVLFLGSPPRRRGAATRRHRGRGPCARRPIFEIFHYCLDQGSRVIVRVHSVRPNHLSGHNFDHDYDFGLPHAGAGCPITGTVIDFTPWEETGYLRVRTEFSTNCSYSHPLRHIQYRRIASLRAIATWAIARWRRMARCTN